MSVAVIEFNDVGLGLVCSGKLQWQSPGYALFGREPPLLGEEARRAARLEPLNIDNRFWSELDERLLSNPAAGGRSHADLAYLHLAQFKDHCPAQLQSLLCAVPASMHAAELSLVFTVARECGLPVAGFVDAAAAVASTWPGRCRFIYVDLHLHAVVVTAVELAEEARRVRREVFQRGGLLELYQAWMGLIARVFVARTRFDPLLHARTEQALFEALPGWLEQLATEPSLQIEMAFGADVHSIPLAREELVLEVRALYDQILARVHRLRRAGQPTVIALGANAARLPGLVQCFDEFNDCDIVACPPGAPALAAEAHAGLWPVAGEEVTLLSTLPRLPAAEAALAAAVLLRKARPIDQASAPTHVLYRGQAHALSTEPILIGSGVADGQTHCLQVRGASAGVSRLHCSLLRTAQGAFVIDHSRYGTWLNDEAVLGRAALRAGDRVRLGSPGVTLDLIAIG